MDPDTVEAEVRAILEGWTITTLENRGPFWTIAGVDPYGTPRAGSRADAVSLAQTLAGLAVAPEPEPEPVSADNLVTPTPDAASVEPPPAIDGGSLSDEPVIEVTAEGAQQFPAGTMIDTRAGIMAADKTEELRAKKVGETVLEHRRLVDASFTVSEARKLQQLRSRSNGAAKGELNPLTDEEQAELDRLAMIDWWSDRMDRELQDRLVMLGSADSDALQAYSARGNWP